MSFKRIGLGRTLHGLWSRRMVDNAGVKLALQVTGFEKRGGRLVEDIELPIGTVEELRGVFPGTAGTFPYFLDDFPVVTVKQVRALQQWCGGHRLNLEDVDYFIGVVSV